MSAYLISPIAESDLDEIVTYIAQDNVPAAFKVLDTFFEAMNMLSENPQVGHLRIDLTNHAIRFWPVKSHYLIIYKDTNPIEIVRVLSGYRDIASLLL